MTPAHSPQRSDESRLLGALELADFGILVTDARGTVLLANPSLERIVGPGALDIPLADWTHSQGVYQADGATPCPSRDLPWIKALAGEVVEGEDLFIRNPHALEGVWVTVSAQPLSGAEDGTARAVVIFHDVTRRRRAEDLAEAARLSAEAAARARDQFLARVSHDLRTPLNAILGFASLLIDGEPPLAEKQRRYAEHIRTAGEELLGKIGSLLELSRAASGVTQLDYRSCDLVDLASQVLQAFEPLAAKLDVRLELTSAPRRLPATVDEGRLKRALSEIVANAVKFSSSGGCVELQVERVEDAEAASGPPPGRPIARISVTDAGSGVAAADQRRVLNGLEPGDTSYAARRQSGLGVGLGLARSLAELHGGSVWLESEGIDGRGTRVHLEVPEEPAGS